MNSKNDNDSGVLIKIPSKKISKEEEERLFNELNELQLQEEIEKDKKEEEEHKLLNIKANEEAYSNIVCDTNSIPSYVFANRLDDLINGIFDDYSGDERTLALKETLARANDLNMGYLVRRKIEEVSSHRGSEVDEEIISEIMSHLADTLSRNQKGNIEETYENICNILEQDFEISQHIRYNEMAGKLEYWENGVAHTWEDKHDAWLLVYMEEHYGISSKDKIFVALNNLYDAFSYHPVKRLIEQEEWDGVPRIDKFLCEICGCDDDDYSREVSRMIFYGGIHRIYDPGCKFDYMPIFIGNQGCGKSSIVNWLNISSDYYREVLSIEGKDALDILVGGWICEFSELQGMVRAKDLEALKGFITRQKDVYRPAYARYSVERPRNCIFIGTTNDKTFLTDKTGNRRYLPVDVKMNGDYIHSEKRMTFIKNYILQCWREAFELLKRGETYLSIPAKYNELLQDKQCTVVVDDPQVGLIKAYLDKQEVGYRVCSLELFVECLNGLKDKFSNMQSRDISKIMNNMPDWERSNHSYIFDKYGQQRYWQKIK